MISMDLLMAKGATVQVVISKGIKNIGVALIIFKWILGSI
tara:strand:- start:655 stop:774 length:120 start_codon:yes stop_codon:yes gene_type:complete